MAFTALAINNAIDAALTGVTHIQLHTGAPGAAGTSNVAAGVSRTAASGVGGATGPADVITGTFTIPGAGGPYTHYSLWTASSGGTFVNDGTLTPNETFAGAGTLAVTINVTGT
jgi:hypothetical protein